MQNQQYHYEAQQDEKLNTMRLFYKNKEKFYQSIGFDGVQLLISVMFIGFIIFFGIRTIDGFYSLDMFVLLFGLSQLIIQNISQVSDVIRRAFDSRIQISKMRDIFDEFDDLLGYESGNRFKPQWWEIIFKHVSYGYQWSSEIFIDLSLVIEAQKKTALVWPSWWGKSTLIKLIAGYLHPQSGEILVDRQALPTPQNCHSEWSETKWRIYIDPSQAQDDIIDHISLQSYYPHIWYLTQEPSVFDGTVWENLTYWLQAEKAPEKSEKWSEKSENSKHLNASENFELSEKIDKIIRLARCEFIYDFKDWLQTEIGEKGVRLSWGQRQRLAIAKIMLKDPSIILLDEPTSALDSENEELVTQALNELFAGKTVIVIAHRLQTVKHADQILYIEQGQITESGTHQELLAKQGKYYKMVELQSGF